MGTMIVGTGIAEPPNVVSNDDLTKIMDTTDEWIRSRTGVESRRFVEAGVGASELGAQAALAALDDARVDAAEVDAVVCATMTPDRQNPGIAGALQHRAGLCNAAVFDIRQQCAGFLFALDLADMLTTTGRAATVLAVGAEVHAGYLPWGDTWEIVLGRSDRAATEAERALATRHRAWSVLFGDGAGAMVLRADPARGDGILGSVLYTDGAHADLIEVPGLGSLQRPYADAAQIAEELQLPTMNGGGLYRMAVESMPEAVRQVVKKAGCDLNDVDLVVAHQANERILGGVRKRLDVDDGVIPSNIGWWGNTTAATLPILYHEMRAQGRVDAGSLVAFTAFGAGAHWGALLYREPTTPRIA
ncbi:MAG: hypothetical protein OXB92_06865 [Acidimicrobiaceae bacterium]|nr:3-oxoacyl-ACP synthase [Acidimicrobiia bacterium]MCY4493556.1 hypothetical protein [Acidimicrobiaceae bacterium]